MSITSTSPAAEAFDSTRLAVNQAKKKEGGVAVYAIARGGASTYSRSLIGRVFSTGQVCAIRLTGRGVLATHFSTPVILDCSPSNQPGAFDYARPAEAKPLATRPKATAPAPRRITPKTHLSWETNSSSSAA